jgi:hypothetical protein
MKYSKWFNLVWAMIIALIVLGCGGGGGGGGGTTNTTATGSTSTGSNDSIVTKIVAQISPGVYIDPRGIQVGQTVQFILVNFDVTQGTASPLSGGFYLSSGPGATPGHLSSSGAFTATTVTSNAYTISTNYLGTNYSAPYLVTPVEPRVAGQIVDTNGKPIPFAQAEFYDGSTNLVAQSTSDVNGNFIASVPQTAKRINLNSTTISSGNYFGVFAYGSGTYDILAASCSAPLPALPVNGTIALPNTLQVFATVDSGGVANTPPAPPGCSP